MQFPKITKNGVMQRSLFIILDRLSHQIIHLNKWVEIPRPLLKILGQSSQKPNPSQSKRQPLLRIFKDTQYSSKTLSQLPVWSFSSNLISSIKVATETLLLGFIWFLSVVHSKLYSKIAKKEVSFQWKWIKKMRAAGKRCPSYQHHTKIYWCEEWSTHSGSRAAVAAIAWLPSCVIPLARKADSL